jgi:integrase
LRLDAARYFFEDVAGGKVLETALRALTAADIEGFVVRYARGRGPGLQRVMRSALRLVLRFTAMRGFTATSLVDAVPGLRSYKLAQVPRGIGDDAIRRLLASVPDNTAASCRDRALLLILATYGVRGGQVCSLRLDDLDWPTRRVRFRAHKGGKEVIHTITAAVGAAVARYLKHFRPAASAMEVFLRARPPHEPLSASAVSAMVRGRMVRAGLTSPSYGTHAFRHAFATRLLAAGQPLKAIADLLGHRDLESAAIYAKVDRRALAEVAAEWPEVLR